MSTSRRALLAATAATVAGLAVLTPAPAHAATSGTACDPALVAPATSLIGQYWRSIGGERSAYGCPVTKEYRYANKPGSYQTFQRGKIVWSPNIGPKALVRVYESGKNIVFRWNDTGRDWDFFQVRWAKDPQLRNKTRQVRVARINPWSGVFTLPKNVAVEYAHSVSHGRSKTSWQFSVQGCDRGTFGSDCGPWSNVVSYSHY